MKNTLSQLEREPFSATVGNGNVSRLKTVIGVASGNSLEMYDFMVFGYYAR